MDNTSAIYASVFCSAAAIFFLYVSYDSYTSYHKTRDWISKEAVIETSHLESGQGVHLDVTVRIIENDRIMPVDLLYGTFISQQDYREMAKKFPEGARTVIYQNPDNDREAVLQKRESLNPFFYMWLLIGILFVFTQILLLKKWVQSHQ